MLHKYAHDTYLIIPSSNIATRIDPEIENIEKWSKQNNLTLNRFNQLRSYSQTQTKITTIFSTSSAT